MDIFCYVFRMCHKLDTIYDRSAGAPGGVPAPLLTSEVTSAKG